MGAVEGKLAVTQLGELNREMSLHLFCDSLSGVKVTHKTGLGRMKHLEIKQLWLQQEVREGKISVDHWPGLENPADLYTKALDNRRFRYLCEMVGMSLNPESFSETTAAAAADHAVAMLAMLSLDSLPEVRCFHCQQAVMVLRASHTGQLLWWCSACDQTTSWTRFQRAVGGQPVDAGPIPHVSAAAAGGQQPIAPKRRVRASTSSAGHVAQTMNVQVTAGGVGEQELPIDAAVARPAIQRQSAPTRRQIDYMAMLATRLSMDVAAVLQEVTTKAEASDMIDRLRAQRR
jgi:hypothetical protein